MKPEEPTPYSQTIIPRPVSLGPEGEKAFATLLKSLSWREGFEFDIVISDHNVALENLIERLKALPEFKEGAYLFFDRPEDLGPLAQNLIEDIPARIQVGEQIPLALVYAKGKDEELRAAWRRSLAVLNEQRNRLVRVLPRPLIFMGPLWFSDWVRQCAPDLYSIHSRLLLLPTSLDLAEISFSMDIDQAATAGIRQKEEPNAEYYLDLAKEFEGSKRKGEVQSRLRLLKRATERDIELRNYDRAWETSKKMLELARKASIYEAESIALHCQGIILQNQFRYNEAIKAYEEALKIDEKLGFEINKGPTFNQLGILAKEKGNFEKAKEYFLKALQIYSELGFNAEYAHTLHNLGILSQNIADFSMAEKYYRKAIEIKEKLGDRFSLAATFHQLGILADEQKKYSEAEEYFRKSIEITDRFNDRYHQAISFHHLGIVSHKQGKLQEAARYYQMVIKISYDLNERLLLAGALHQFGIISREKGNLNEAEENFKKALAIFSEVLDFHHEAAVIHELGIVAEIKNDFLSALENYLRAFETFIKLRDRYGSAIVMISLSRLRRKSPETGIVEAVAKALGISATEAERMLDEAEGTFTPAHEPEPSEESKIGPCEQD